ncbi:MAG: BMC domain-containing protein [Chloroflexota bacterium]
MTDPMIPKKNLIIEPALALLEFSSVAAGVFAGDAMVKRAQLDFIHAGTVQPGRYLILIGGNVAEVEEALKVGQKNALDSLIDYIFLPGVHPDVVRAIGGGRETRINDALGIVETLTVPSAIQAADKGIKGAQVSLVEIRLADGLNGKGLVFFTGLVSDVEAAIELSTGSLQTGQLVKQVVIAKLHAEMAALIQSNSRFGAQVGWNFKE